MDCDVSPELQAAASAQSCAPAPSISPFDGALFDEESDAGPPLETCKRELDAVLASLDA